MIKIKTIERDIILLNMAYILYKDDGRELGSDIQGYDHDKLSKFAETLNIFKNDTLYEESVKQLVNEAYKRVRSKFDKR